MLSLCKTRMCSSEIILNSILLFLSKKEEPRTICTFQHARRFLSDLPQALTPGRGIPPCYVIDRITKESRHVAPALSAQPRSVALAEIYRRCQYRLGHT